MVTSRESSVMSLQSSGLAARRWSIVFGQILFFFLCFACWLLPRLGSRKFLCLRAGSC